jgi:glycosyltransferase involved in cell wall biosynthesis
MVTLSHPIGNPNLRAVGNGLADAGLLSAFYTSIASFDGSLLNSLSAVGPLAEIKKRHFDNRLRPFTHTAPFVDIGRLLFTKLKADSLIRHEVGPFCIDAVFRYIDTITSQSLKKAAGNGTKAVYAYEDGAEETFKTAKQLNIKCLYDLPIGYWRTARILLEQELERRPEWAVTLTGFNDSIVKLQKKDEELKLADIIFVASKFTASSLSDFPGKLKRIEVIPYGFPPVANNRIYSKNLNKRLKLLFVGGLSQRKGIANLFEAVDAYKNYVELTVVGRKANVACPALDAELIKHNWISSLAHNQILDLMAEHDVFVFPSLFEGFGLVITEAMSQGTPVITTERTAGPDLITPNENGWLVEAGSTDALKGAIENILQKRSVVAEVGAEALEKAKSRTWQNYGAEVAAAIKKILDTE